MENIPSSPAEVKQIIEAVHFKTMSRFTYLKGDGGLCRFPFGVSWDGDKELSFPLDLQDVAGDDPDRDFLLIDPPDLQPGESCYTDAPALYFNRPAKPGEVDELRLAIWRARAAAAADPERARPNEASMPDPARDNVVELPGVNRSTEKHNRPPRIVLKYAKAIKNVEDWKRVYALMYAGSVFGPLNTVWGYAGKSARKGRYYAQGNEELTRLSCLSMRTISTCLMKMKKDKLILLHKRGWPGEKCSIWELPFSLDHVFAWRRKPSSGRHRSS
jgi:hypothetical protein